MRKTEIKIKEKTKQAAIILKKEKVKEKENG